MTGYKKMLEDLKYNTMKDNARSYEIMLLREQHGKSFSDISGDLGLSKARTALLYSSLKYKQIKLYINHISVVLGYDDISQIRNIYCTAYECYQDKAYACAYLEKEYKDILIKYRNGEPGMPEEFLAALPPLTPPLSKENIARIVELKEKKKANFSKIAKEFNITKQKAERTYDTYYHSLTLETIKKLYAKTEGKEEKEAIWDYCFRNNYSAKKRYDMLINSNIYKNSL